jgi:hypothetical protein
MKTRYIWLLVVGVLSIVVVLGIGFWIYFTHFNGQASVDSRNWADFATFNGYFVGIINMLFVGIIGFITYRTTHEFNLTQLRPLIILATEEPITRTGQNPISWYVVNGANSPASNVLVRFSFEPDGDTFSKWVSCYPLSANSKQELPWLHWANRIEVCYADITEKKFYRYMFKDLTGETKSISMKEFNGCLKEAKDNRDNNTTNLRDKLIIHLGNGGSLQSQSYKMFILKQIFK